ncbi:MAG: 5-formyltetrahydrofolate cyclo-ligase [Synechococcaceae cyanobacterium]
MGDLGGDAGEKAELRRHFRRLRRQALPAASDGLSQRALAALPPLLPAGRRLGLYWPVGSEPDLVPLALGGLAERLPAGMALPAVLPAGAGVPPPPGGPWSPKPPSGLALGNGSPQPPGNLAPADGLPQPLSSLASDDGLPAPPSTLAPGAGTPTPRPPSTPPSTPQSAPQSAPQSPLLAPPQSPPPPLAGPPERLIYLPWAGEVLRGRDACGIPAPLPPPGSPWRELEADALGLLLVPALAIDQHGIRLGSGGGWYDRLRADPVWRAVPALAVLPAACVCQELPRDPWDVPFAGWLDERGLTLLEPRR